MTTPRVLSESQTTLPEDTFHVVTDVDAAAIKCIHCDQRVCWLDHADDLNTLVRLSFEHWQTCKGEGK